MTKRGPALGAWAATAVLFVAIGVLTLTPAVAAAAAGNDKLGHFTAFALLVLPLSIAYPNRCLAVFTVAIAYGLAIELIQPYVGRDAEVADFVADVLGAALGALAGRVIGGWLARRMST